MNRADLYELDRLLDGAEAVVPMCDIWAGNRSRDVIGMRHDVDDNPDSLRTAVYMAEWENERGYRSTFFLLHDSSYWDRVTPVARHLVDLGHEVGLHNNAIAEGIRQHRNPFHVLGEALHVLRCAVPVIGTVAHGDALCRDHIGRVRFVNDEIWMECRRPEMGDADREIDGRKLEQRSLWEFGLKYESNWLPRGDYISDSGGFWNKHPYRHEGGQLHMLVHPDWWSVAFDKVTA